MQAQDMMPGTVFPSPRPEEGIVVVVCSAGRCKHDPSRDEFGTHVRAADGGEFFVNMVPTEEIHVCGYTACKPFRLTPEWVKQHNESNVHAR